MTQIEPVVTDWALRLSLATGAGAIIGLNRDLKHKAAGVRTHTLVSLSAALLVLTQFELVGQPPDLSSVGRIIQGIVTGIGFLGAGVIVRPPTGDQVRGLTTAASIWTSAAFGIGFAVGAVRITGVAFGLTLVVLLLGGPFERAFHRLFGVDRTPPSESV